MARSQRKFPDTSFTENLIRINKAGSGIHILKGDKGTYLVRILPGLKGEPNLDSEIGSLTLTLNDWDNLAKFLKKYHVSEFTASTYYAMEAMHQRTPLESKASHKERLG